MSNFCVVCDKPMINRKGGRQRKTCGDACKKRLSRSRIVTPVTKTLTNRDKGSCTPYNASNIVIMGTSDRMSNPIFDWDLAENLAREHNRPVEWIQRSILACREAGVSPQYFIDRYILMSPIPMNKAVDQAFRDFETWD